MNFWFYMITKWMIIFNISFIFLRDRFIQILTCEKNLMNLFLCALGKIWSLMKDKEVYFIFIWLWNSLILVCMMWRKSNSNARVHRIREVGIQMNIRIIKLRMKLRRINNNRKKQKKNKENWFYSNREMIKRINYCYYNRNNSVNKMILFKIRKLI